jgi:xanthine dehydrogenase YagS FAD-binding subunit
MAWHIGIDEPANFEVLAPRTLDEAASLMALHGRDAMLFAGGSDVLDQLKHQWRTPRYVINLKAISGLRGIREERGSLVLGALTTLAETAEHPGIRDHLAGYAEALLRAATPQIRNLATVGGNLLQDSRCPYYRGPWHCYRAGGITCDARHGINIGHAIFGADRCYTVSPSDTAPMLVALDAAVRVWSSAGTVEQPVAGLFVAPGENIRVMHRLEQGQILTEIVIPLRDGQRFRFVKAAMREAWDFAAASAAVAFVEQGGVCRTCRIVLGGVAAVPWRSRAAELAVEGVPLTPAVIEAASGAAVEGAEPLADNGYKVPLVRALVREALSGLAA